LAAAVTVAVGVFVVGGFDGFVGVDFLAVLAVGMAASSSADGVAGASVSAVRTAAFVATAVSRRTDFGSRPSSRPLYAA
jgi:hypothetical protein